ncbi:MAG: restriction endonuclease subunit S [Candidatus Cloacimonetes bacterium]|nr:restriction endonuclease subunit S [Candidatus Cloacimonadota bacterium]
MGKQISKIKLLDVSEIIMGQSPDSSFCNTESIGIPFLQGCGEFGKKNPEATNYCSNPKKISPKNSILISVRAPVGDLNISDQIYVIGRGLAGIVATTINQKFLYYSILQFRRNLARVSQGSTFEAINSSDLHSFEINEFPLPHQRKIARILTTIDNVIETTESAIAKYKAIKQGMMHDLFTRGIDIETGKLRPNKEDAPHLYKKTELGWIPKEWEVNNILSSTYLKGRIGWQGLKASEFIEEGPFLVTGTDFEDGNIDWNGCYHISEKRYSEAKYIQLRNDDVLITKDGTIGKIAYVKECPNQAVLNSGIFLMRCKDGSYINKYLFWLLNSSVFNSFLYKSLGGSTIIHLYQREFEKFQFCIPSINEQIRLINKLESANIRIDTEQMQLAKVQKLKQGLMQDLLTGKKEVEPDKEDYEDE